MKTINKAFFLCFTLALIVSCSSTKKMNDTEKGAAIGGGGGAVVGAVIGKLTGHTALGAIVGAAVGGTTGAIIGHHMDKQAAEIKQQVPGAKVERVAEGIDVEFSSAVLFGIGKSNLSPQADQTLNQLVTILVKYPDTNVEVQGHTDSTGTTEINQPLSVARATAVANYLIANNVAAQRITTKGFGSTEPKYSNSTEEGRAGNRRVEFLITANDKMKTDAAKEANTAAPAHN